MATKTKTKTKQHVLYVTIYKTKVIAWDKAGNPITRGREFLIAYYPATSVNVKNGKIVIRYKDHQNRNRQVSYYASTHDAEIRRETY